MSERAPLPRLPSDYPNCPWCQFPCSGNPSEEVELPRCRHVLHLNCLPALLRVQRPPNQPPSCPICMQPVPLEFFQRNRPDGMLPDAPPAAQPTVQPSVTVEHVEEDQPEVIHTFPANFPTRRRRASRRIPADHERCVQICVTTGQRCSWKKTHGQLCTRCYQRSITKKTWDDVASFRHAVKENKVTIGAVQRAEKAFAKQVENATALRRQMINTRRLLDRNTQIRAALPASAMEMANLYHEITQINDRLNGRGVNTETALAVNPANNAMQLDN